VLYVRFRCTVGVTLRMGLRYGGVMAEEIESTVKQKVMSEKDQ